MKTYLHHEGGEFIHLVRKDEHDAIVDASESAVAAYESTKTGNLPDPLAEAVKRMEEVPTEELEDVYFDSTSMGCEGVQLPDDHDHGLARIRARLIQAAKGEQP